MTTIAPPKTKRVIGVVRVSEVGGRDPDNLHSPDIQADQMTDACERKGFKRLDTLREIDVSGARPLSKRPGLRAAVEAIERGDADIVMVAYFDRLVRNLKVQQEVVERVERAGGEVLTLDVGQLTNGTAVQRLTANFLGAVAQFVSEQTGEKAAAGQRRAVEGGKFIGPAPVGYTRHRSNDGRLRVDHGPARFVRGAFKRRAEGASYADIRDYLAEHRIERTVSGVRAMLASRVYLGEVNFGGLFHRDAHEAIVSQGLFKRVQDTHGTGGRKTKSPRLLARLGVLRCGCCGGRMSASTRGKYPFYRCASQACDHPQTIGAPIVEPLVVETVKGALSGVTGAAGVAPDIRAAESTLAEAETALSSALSTFTGAGVLSEPDAIARLAELRTQRDDARAALVRLHARGGILSVTATRDWDRLTVGEQRALIQATIESVTVAPGRGVERLAVKLFSE